LLNWFLMAGGPERFNGHQAIYHPYSGLYLDFEGGEGSGKTTQAELLQRRMKESGLEYVAVREPGGTVIGIELRGMLLTREAMQPTAITEAYLFAADRAQLIGEKIIPALQAGYIVGSDRCVLSSVAHQGYAQGLGSDVVWAVNRVALQGVLPDRVILLNIEPEEGLRRRQESRGELNKIDRRAQEYHRKVYEAYLAMVQEDPRRWYVVDATLPKEEQNEIIFDLILHELQEKAARVAGLAYARNPSLLLRMTT